MAAFSNSGEVSVKNKTVRDARNSASPKPLREKCWRVTHDSLFSDWKLLIAADDWSNHEQGISGTARYRIANLPHQTGPGVYELGVLPDHVVRQQRRVHGSQVRVVYVGHSDNVRSRMQQYGVSGSHLKALLEGVFESDYAVTFRWTPATTKAEAAATETLLLTSFDYVWNVSHNEHRRHDRLLTKLQVGPSFSRRIAIAFPVLPVARFLTPVAVGTDISCVAAAAAAAEVVLKASTKASAANARAATAAAAAVSAANLFPPGSPLSPRTAASPRADFSAAQQQNRARDRAAGTAAVGTGAHDRPPATAACNKPGRATDRTPERTPGRAPGGAGVVVCGAALSHGGVCTAAAVEGRVRCARHKGMRAAMGRGTVCEGVRKERREEVCGGSEKATGNGRGGKEGAGGEGTRREGARGEGVLRERPVRAGGGSLVVCGAPLAGGGSCQEVAVKGRVRCMAHKGMRAKGVALA